MVLVLGHILFTKVQKMYYNNKHAKFHFRSQLGYGKCVFPEILGRKSAELTIIDLGLGWA